jgi:hypothetical protein
MHATPHGTGPGGRPVPDKRTDQDLASTIGKLSILSPQISNLNYPYELSEVRRHLYLRALGRGQDGWEVPTQWVRNKISLLPVRQTPTNLSDCVPRKNQPGADGQDRHRDLFSNPMLKRNQILTMSKLHVSGNMRLRDLSRATRSIDRVPETRI